MSEPLLQEQMEELHKWFARVYPQHKLQIYTKWNALDKREEYILDLDFNTTNRSLAFAIPDEYLQLIGFRTMVRDRWVGEMQKKIIAEIG